MAVMNQEAFASTVPPTPVIVTRSPVFSLFVAVVTLISPDPLFAAPVTATE